MEGWEGGRGMGGGREGEVRGEGRGREGGIGGGIVKGGGMVVVGIGE